MPTLKKGSLTLNLGFVQLSGELSEIDRQCAWELYTELTTRVAVTGRANDDDCADFSGEVWAESLASLLTFFRETRRIMRSFPVGRLSPDCKNHLGVLINNVIVDVLRPFLEKWQAEYRYWWDHISDQGTNPFERQAHFPRKVEFLEDWANLRFLMRKLELQIVECYQLVPVRT